MNDNLEDKKAAIKAVKRLGLPSDLRTRAVVLVAADSPAGRDLRTLVQLNEDDFELDTFIKTFLRYDDAGAANVVPDHSLAIMDALFAPFPEAAFPKQLNVPHLITLLESPLATSVPLPMSTYQSVHQSYPDLFSLETNASAPQLAIEFVTAVQAAWPTGSASERLYTPFWNRVGYGLPELIGRQLGLNVSESRGQEDASITIADKRRDYMLHLNNALVVGGEDKPQRHLMYQAVQELLDKHKGASAALYGDLGYLILFATAADAVRVFALELCPGAMLQPLMQEFTVDRLGRQRVVKLFINLIRWLRTVHSLRLLPPAPPAQLLVPFYRDSPYPADEDGHQQNDVGITLHFRSVEKRFTIPGQHLQEQLDVYGLLHHLPPPGAICCKSLEVDGEQMKLRHPMAKARKGLSNSVNCHVRLRLEPVGAVVCMTDAAQLHSMVFSLLSTLMYIHGYGFVHRDIRLDNFLKVTDGWLLIDWELAGRADQMVWWKGTNTGGGATQSRTLHLQNRSMAAWHAYQDLISNGRFSCYIIC